MLSEPKYTQPEVLQVTKLRPEVLQTWLNRDAIALQVQNPGSGKRRLYSALDVVKLAIMRRIAVTLRMDLATAKEIAEAASDDLDAAGDFDWDASLAFGGGLEASGGGLVPFNIVTSSKMPRLSKYRLTLGDARDIRISEYTEWFEQIMPRRSRAKDRPIDDSRRESAARMGWHSEPFTFFPIGEIVNGTLAQLRAIDEKDSSK